MSIDKIHIEPLKISWQKVNDSHTCILHTHTQAQMYIRHRHTNKTHASNPIHVVENNIMSSIQSKSVM